METVDTTNLRNWQQVKVLVNALNMEKEYGCKLSPYTNVLLVNLTKLTNEALQYVKG
jgi:hypothetical protein